MTVAHSAGLPELELNADCSIRRAATEDSGAGGTGRPAGGAGRRVAHLIRIRSIGRPRTRISERRFRPLKNTIRMKREIVMSEAWIIDCVRTPRGRGKKDSGALYNEIGRAHV